MNTIHQKFTWWKNKLRTWYWRHVLGRFGTLSKVTGRITVYYPEQITVGSSTHINEGVILNARAAITIGNYCHLSPGCQLHTGGLSLSRDYTKRQHTAQPIVVGDGVWVGAAAVILPGVTIGEGAVIGAGSVVTTNVSQNTVVVGAPAKEIKQL